MRACLLLLGVACCGSLRIYPLNSSDVDGLEPEPPNSVSLPAVPPVEEESDVSVFMQLPSRPSQSQRSAERQGGQHLGQVLNRTPGAGQESFFGADLTARAVQHSRIGRSSHAEAMAMASATFLRNDTASSVVPGSDAPVLTRLEPVSSAVLAIVLQVLSLTAAALVAAAMLAALLRGGQPKANALRQRVEKLRVTSGAALTSTFLSTEGGEESAHLGCVHRLQGRVVAKSGMSLSAPLSSRPCVLYSASAAQQRQDGVQQHPLAFHSATTEFCIAVPRGGDKEDLMLTLSGQDVSLFDLGPSGRFGANCAFDEAPTDWRGFALAHLTTAGKEPHLASCKALLDLSSRGPPLEFRESSLVVGANVTCIGEVVRDQTGSLSLCPWRPPADCAGQETSSPCGYSLFLPRWRAPSWETVPPKALARTADSLAGQVLISDCPQLLKQGSRELLLGWLLRI